MWFVILLASLLKQDAAPDWQRVTPAPYASNLHAALYDPNTDAAGRVLMYAMAARAVYAPAALDMPDASSRDKALACLSYVSQVMLLDGDTHAHDGYTCLTQGAGQCYEFAQAFVWLCRQVKVPARVVCMKNIPEVMRGHTLAEVWLDGGWRLYDPTYATYSDCSLREALESPESAEPIFRLSVDLHTGEYAPCPGSVALIADFRWPEVNGTRVLDTYRAAFRYANPTGVLFEGRTLVYPVKMSVSSDGYAQLGVVDDSPADMQGERDADWRHIPGTHAPYIGKTQHSQAVHSLQIHVEEPGAYHVIYWFAVEPRILTPGVLPVSGCRVTDVRVTVGRWEIDVDVLDTQAVLLVDRLTDGEYGWTAAVDAIRVEAIG